MSAWLVESRLMHLSSASPKLLPKTLKNAIMTSILMVFCLESLLGCVTEPNITMQKFCELVFPICCCCFCCFFSDRQSLSSETRYCCTMCTADLTENIQRPLLTQSRQRAIRHRLTPPASADSLPGLIGGKKLSLRYDLVSWTKESGKKLKIAR